MGKKADVRFIEIPKVNRSVNLVIQLMNRSVNLFK
jgi:hypothetical protein